jgi:carbamoyl-phosphate synthase large subunit
MVMKNPDLSGLDITIAVSGLKTGDNPQPGVPVIRSLRLAGFTGRIIGLVYDSMESGIYLEDLADAVFQMPYPSAGAEAFLARLDHILAQEKVDVVIPTLDAEVILYIRLEKELAARGIKTFLPTEECFLLRDKTKLAAYFPPKGISVPETVMVSEPNQILMLANELDFPMMVKGRYYEAFKANTMEEGYKYFFDIRERWGLPIIFQKVIPGDEYNIVIVGDGEGGMLGMVPQRKLVITDKGKGFGGVVVKNPELDAFAEKVIRALKWRGPCELEIMKGFDNTYYLIEINPRFPAWVRLAEGAGQNQPAIVVLKALGMEVSPLPEYRPGTLFIRHAEDLIADVSTMGEISAKSEIIRRK